MIMFIEAFLGGWGVGGWGVCGGACWNDFWASTCYYAVASYNIVKLETLCNDYPAVHPFLQGTQTVEFIQVVVPKLTGVIGKGGRELLNPPSSLTFTFLLMTTLLTAITTLPIFSYFQNQRWQLWKKKLQSAPCRPSPPLKNKYTLQPRLRHKERLSRQLVFLVIDNRCQ